MATLLRSRAVAGLLGGLVVLSAASTGCTREVVPGGEAGADGETPPSTTAPAPRPAVAGEEITFGGVELIVVDVTAEDRSPKGLPRVRVVIRTENVDRVERQNPDVVLRCRESDGDGDWFRGSTWEPGLLLPPGAVSEGALLVGFPPKDGAPLYSVATCTDAHVEVRMGGPADVPVRLRYSVPPEVVAESIERPRGKVLPLPLETR